MSSNISMEPWDVGEASVDTECAFGEMGIGRFKWRLGTRARLF